MSFKPFDLVTLNRDRPSTDPTPPSYHVKIRLSVLKRILREVGANGAFPGQPIKNALAPDLNSREQLGAISAKAIDTVQDPEGEGMPDHLLDPTVTPEECYGPVPPDSEPVYVGQDPFARDTSPNPGGSIKRG
jgi:hypothetical protein